MMVLGREDQTQTRRQVLLAGFLAGGIAGAKYTGCLIATAVAVTVAIEFRSAALLSLFILGSLFSGIWTYLKNFVWTGNPVFPFLSERLSPNLVSAYAVTNLANATSAPFKHDPSQLIPFVFLAAVQKNNPGFWDFFGPVVLALAPLMLLAFKNTRAWRIPILVWLFSSLGIFFASGLPRFLLPLFPIALACVAAGMEAARQQKWTVAHRVSIGLLAVMLLVGAAGLTMFCQKPVLAAIGAFNKITYLEQTTQDYQIVEVINRILTAEGNQQRTLVFVRHLYYLDIPYLNGNPDTSFEVDLERLRTVQAWRAFFEKKDIGFVVRSPDYPSAIAEPLNEMEKNEELIPFARTEVQNFQGKRIDQKRTTVPVVILRVRR